MGIICAWCKEVIKEGTGKVSHGICKDCKKTVELESARENKYIMNQIRRFG